jgi:Transcriptional regulator, AbiEi antitoxin
VPDLSVPRCTLGTVPKKLPPELCELAAHQCGILTTEQAVDAGLTRSAIAEHLRTGRWQRMHRGVYATFSGEPGRLAVLWAAVLSAGPGAMLSHQTAAELAGLTDKASDLVHVTVPTERRASKAPGLVIHYSARASESRHPARLPPQTRVEETILDLADAARTVDDACAWVFRGLQRRKTTQVNLARAVDRRARLRWRSELSELLTLDAAGLHSILERRYHKDVERPHGLPAGERQRRYRRGDHNEYRDVFYAAFLTAVELDGVLAHPGEARWRDIGRDNSAAADGIFTLRYGYLDLTGTPCQVAAQVATVLRRRGFAGGHPCSPNCPVAPAEAPIPWRRTTGQDPRNRVAPIRSGASRSLSGSDVHTRPGPGEAVLRRSRPATARQRVSRPRARGGAHRPGI